MGPVCTRLRCALPALQQDAFPNASFAGCFCNGEIGPTPPDELEPAGSTTARMMGYSTGEHALCNPYLYQ